MHPPILFRQRRKRTLQRGFSCRCAAIHLLRRARWKKKALGRLNPTRMCRVDRNTRVVVTGAVQTCRLVPVASHSDLTRAVSRRKWCCRFAFGTLVEWTSVSFRCRCHGAPGQRVAKRNARGLWLSPSVDHPESRSALPNAGQHHLCSSRLKRTRYKPFIFHRTDYNNSRSAVNLTHWCQVEPLKRFLFGPGAAHFSFQEKEKWGAPPPSPCQGDTI